MGRGIFIKKKMNTKLCKQYKCSKMQGRCADSQGDGSHPRKSSSSEKAQPTGRVREAIILRSFSVFLSELVTQGETRVNGRRHSPKTCGKLMVCEEGSTLDT